MATPKRALRGRTRIWVLQIHIDRVSAPGRPSLWEKVLIMSLNINRHISISNIRIIVHITLYMSQIIIKWKVCQLNRHHKPCMGKIAALLRGLYQVCCRIHRAIGSPAGKMKMPSTLITITLRVCDKYPRTIKLMWCLNKKAFPTITIQLLLKKRLSCQTRFRP